MKNPNVKIQSSNECQMTKSQCQIWHLSAAVDDIYLAFELWHLDFICHFGFDI
jgi:hypothetical protein